MLSLYPGVGLPFFLPMGVGSCFPLQLRSPNITGIRYNQGKQTWFIELQALLNSLWLTRIQGTFCKHNSARTGKAGWTTRYRYIPIPKIVLLISQKTMFYKTLIIILYGSPFPNLIRWLNHLTTLMSSQLFNWNGNFSSILNLVTWTRLK